VGNVWAWRLAGPILAAHDPRVYPRRVRTTNDGGLNRRILLEGATNLRDIGGYQTTDGRHTRWRVIYRSGALDRLSQSAANWLIDNGLKTVIDLRAGFELVEAPDVFAGSDRVRYRRLPLFDAPLPADVPPPSLVDGYRRILFQCAPRIRAIFDELLQPDGLPAVIHCAGGKDRTGVVIALLLAAVGVANDDIVDDYALTAASFDQDFVVAARNYAQARGWSLERTREQWTCPPQVMRDMLAEVDRRYGSREGYLLNIGLEPQQLEQLKALICS
jgi:protein-tyrosine phosphatase